MEALQKMYIDSLSIVELKEIYQYIKNIIEPKKIDEIRPMIDTNKPEYMILYTDGYCSGNPGAGGYSWKAQDSKGNTVAYCPKTEISKNTTNNRMEFEALCNALHFISKSYKGNLKCYTDSKLLIDYINKNCTPRNKELCEYARQILELSFKFSQFSLLHTPRETIVKILGH